LTEAPTTIASETRSPQQLETAMTVSMSHRVLDAAETAQPATASALLRQLGIAHVSVEKQKVHLERWLLEHEPQRRLRISLRENGYGLLVKETDEKRAAAASVG
jgi:hypothetical protein